MCVSLCAVLQIGWVTACKAILWFQPSRLKGELAVTWATNLYDQDGKNFVWKFSRRDGAETSDQWRIMPHATLATWATLKIFPDSKCCRSQCFYRQVAARSLPTTPHFPSQPGNVPGSGTSTWTTEVSKTKAGVPLQDPLFHLLLRCQFLHCRHNPRIQVRTKRVSAWISLQFSNN